MATACAPGAGASASGTPTAPASASGPTCAAAASACSSASACFRSATSASAQGAAGESPFAAARDSAARCAPRPRMPAPPVFGTNDWYYQYGDSHPDRILETTRLVVSVSPGGPNRPWSVVDDGWSPGGDESGMWDRGNERFGDMAALRGRDCADRGASGHLVPAAARRCQPPRLAAPRPQPPVPRPEPPGRARDRRTRHAPAARVGLRADQARLLELRHHGPLGLLDGRDAHRRWLAVRGFEPNDRGDRDGALPGDPRCGRRRARHRLQHVQPPVRGPVRDQPHRRRHQRPVVGPDAPDGRQHPGVQGAAPRRLSTRPIPISRRSPDSSPGRRVGCGCACSPRAACRRSCRPRSKR